MGQAAARDPHRDRARGASSSAPGHDDRGRRAMTAARRSALSTVLVVVAAVTALAGGVALYARTEVVDSRAFAQRAVAALEDDGVRRVAVTEIVVQLIDQRAAQLVSARPVLEGVVDLVLQSEPGRRVVRLAADQGHRLLFTREDTNVAFDVADAGQVVIPALRSVAPAVARRLPPRAEARLFDLRERDFATQTLRVADDVRLLGLVLPALALVLLVLAVAVAPDRRRAVTRAGIALGVAGGLLAVALAVVEARVVAVATGGDELTDDDVRDAVRGLWAAYLGDLTRWALAVGALGLVTAAAAASLLRPFDTATGLARLARWVRPPARRGPRVAHALAAVGLGVLVVASPALALEVVAIVAGALLVHHGAAQLLSVVEPRTAAVRPARRPARLRPGRLLGAAGAVVLGALVLALLSRQEEAPPPAAAAVRTCNGFAELCPRRLDRVVFAGTHNSMSAADVRGWSLVNQRRALRRQLKDGIRLFLIDPHYGVRDDRGRVRTDFQAERRDLNRVAQALSPAALAAVERLGGRLGRGDLEGGRRDVFLCHAVCELGATRMVDALRELRRFLERNPGEVVIVFDEDYVSEADLAGAYREAGLLPHLVTLDGLEPLPTLGQLVRADRRMIVLTERTPSGEYPWNNDGFAWVQDTPLGATRPEQLSCARTRGTADSPLLLMNHWIDRYPPSPAANRSILREEAIVRRARRCRRERGMLPTLIATDFYDEGELVRAVQRLNGLGARPRPPVR